MTTLLVILVAAGQTTAAERLWVYSTPAGFLDSSPAIGDDDGTVPGKEELPAVRVLADQRWQIVQATRREIATLLAALRRHP